jgi:hypothetical protein
MSKERAETPFQSPRLVDVREQWAEAAELPFAYQDPENIITDNSVALWIIELQKREKEGTLPDLPKGVGLPLLMSELVQYYMNLRFLSKTNAVRGLSAIAKDIRQNFDPKNSLILVNDKSNYFMYTGLAQDLPEFGRVSWWGSEQKLGGSNLGAYAKSDPAEAETIIHVDDWVLCGEQLPQSIKGVTSKEQLFTYHLVMSDKGKTIYDNAG